MRKIVLSLLVGFVSQAFAQGPVSINLSIASKDVKGKLYLERLNDRGFAEKIDSIAITKQEFVFDTKVAEPGIYQLNLANEQLIGLILDGGEQMSVKADGMTIDDKPALATVSGVNNMSTFNAIQQEQFAFMNLVKEIDTKFKAAKNDATRMKLREEYLSALKNHEVKILPSIKSLGTSAAGILASNNFLSLETSAEYLDQLANQLQAEKKNHKLAQLFIQKVNQEKMGKPGISAPDFELKDINGKIVRLSDYRGKTVILDFWATWCGPCIMSFPGMKKAMDKFKDRDDVAFIYLNTFERVSADKTLEHVSKFVKNRGFEYLNTVMDENNQTAFMYGVSSIPTKFFIDKEGKFIHMSRGFAGSDDAVVNEISQFLDNHK